MQVTWKILVIDDDPDILDVMTITLKDAGYSVLCAPDGQSGILLAKSHFPQIVITDIKMPGMSGLELAHAMSSETRLASIPVLMLTARGHLLHDGEMRSPNIVAIVHKPFSPRALLADVVSILAIRQQQHERSVA